MITTYKDDLPFSEKGFGLDVNLYCAGRICASVAKHGGLTQVSYQGNQPIDRFRLLEAPESSVFTKLARVEVFVDGVPYRLCFEKTVHYPFGYASECVLGGVRLKHELILDNNVLFQRVTVLENQENKRITARMVHSSRTWNPKIARRTGPEWRPDTGTGTLNAEILDEGKTGPVGTVLRLGALQNSTFSLLETQSFKFYLNSPVPADEHVFYLAFNPTQTEDLSSERISAKIQQFEKKMENVTRFETGNPVLDSALVNANAVTADFEIEVPGALRASPFYWVWAWDSMVHAESLILGGWSEVVKRMLFFFKKYDLAMQYPADFKTERSLIPCTQLFYVVMLYHYYAMTGDKETLESCLPYARDLVESVTAKVGLDGSLALGRGLFPDYPSCLGQSETDDYAVLNNSVYFQGLRAWHELTGELGDVADKVGENFVKLFWDDSEGYWCDSVDGKTGEQRTYYPCYGQLYISPFGLDLQRDEYERTAAFMKANFLSEHGIRMLPLDRPGFMADGMQLGEFFPVTDRYYWNMMNMVGDSEAPEDFERIITAYWQICTFPEGQTNEVVNTNPAEYEDSPGLKQAFTAKPWVCDAFEVNLGLRVKLAGIYLNPIKGPQPFKVKNMVLRNHKITIERKAGAGERPVFSLNGKVLAKGFVAWDDLAAENVIAITWQ
jgi:hypothetical protein